MDRRNFFRALVGGVATAAAVRKTWPFRVYSFPASARISPEVGMRMLETMRLHGFDRMILAGDWGFEPGQMIAAYDASGRLSRGVFRIVRVDEVTRELFIEYAEPATLPDPIAAPLANVSQDPWSAWKQKLLGA